MVSYFFLVSCARLCIAVLAVISSRRYGILHPHKIQIICTWIDRLFVIKMTRPDK
jgi:hypothetical protein